MPTEARSTDNEGASGVLAVLALATGANLLRSLRSVLVERCFSEESPAEPVRLVAYMTPPCFLFLFMWSSFTERSEPYKALTLGTFLMLLLTCVSAVVLNVSNFYAVQVLGATGTQIAGVVNVMLTIMCAGVFLHEEVKFTDWIGIFTILAGTKLFQNAARAEKEKAEMEAALQAAEERGRAHAAYWRSWIPSWPGAEKFEKQEKQAKSESASDPTKPESERKNSKEREKTAGPMNPQEAQDREEAEKPNVTSATSGSRNPLHEFQWPWMRRT